MFINWNCKNCIHLLLMLSLMISMHCARIVRGHCDSNIDDLKLNFPFHIKLYYIHIYYLFHTRFRFYIVIGRCVVCACEQFSIQYSVRRDTDNMACVFWAAEWKLLFIRIHIYEYGRKQTFTHTHTHAYHHHYSIIIL